MAINRGETTILLIGDIIIFYSALWLMLLIRYATVPSEGQLMGHVIPFTFLFFVWLVSFYIAGLYDKNTILLKGHLVRLILNTQVINIALAVLFFYFVPFFGITPKTNLFIYLVISLVFIVVWRLYGAPLFGSYQTRKRAIIIGKGEEIYEIIDEVNENKRYGVKFVSSIDIKEYDIDILERKILLDISSKKVEIIVIDIQNEKVKPILSHMYGLIFSDIEFIDVNKIYEEIFDRIPVSSIRYNWFLENISRVSVSYDILKRIMDIVAVVILSIPTLMITPLIAVLIKLEDGGPILINQKRIGKNNRLFSVHKFRTMTGDDGGEDNPDVTLRDTKIGPLLRKTHIDELPQIWSVIKGDQSLIGPRPELPRFVNIYEEEIPFYNVRHIIKPGLSGWAQLCHTAPPKRMADIDQTRRKLSYDMYYIKNRSLWLDLQITLKTLKSLISRTGL